VRDAAGVPLRPAAACLALLLLDACATATPVGARPLLAEGYEPFARPALPREAPPVPEVAAAPLAVPRGARDTALAAARTLLGRSHMALKGKAYGDDCVGLVRAAYDQIGVNVLSAATPADNGVTAIWRFAAQHGRVYDGGRPVAGDLVFFKDTWDVNRDGRVNDGLSHIGLVDEVEPDGTVIVIHRVARGVVRYRMNLEFPEAQKSPAGRPINDYLRAASAGAKPQLTSQLFAGYATVLPVEPRLAQAKR